nr:PREDICTED: protein FAM150B [Bos mutus]
MCQLQASSHHPPGQRQRAQWGLPAQRKAALSDSRERPCPSAWASSSALDKDLSKNQSVASSGALGPCPLWTSMNTALQTENLRQDAGLDGGPGAEGPARRPPGARRAGEGGRGPPRSSQGAVSGGPSANSDPALPAAPRTGLGRSLAPGSGPQPRRQIPQNTQTLVDLLNELRKYHSGESKRLQLSGRQDYTLDRREVADYAYPEEQRVEIVPRDLRMKDKFLKHLTGPLYFSPKCSKHFHRLYHNTRDCTIPAYYKRCARLLTRLAVSPMCVEG